jgi:citrate synthase
MSENPYPNYSPGLQGIVGGLTAISEIVSSESRLTYRGINVHDLAEKGSFEETSFLLIHGHLPSQAELDAYRARLDSARSLPDAVIQALRLVPEGTHPMDTLRMAYALLTGFDADYENHDHDANVRKAERMLAMAPTIVAAAHRISHGQEPVAPKTGVGHAANFLFMLHGEDADDYTAMVMDASLTLYAEHTYNASTFACRVTVATLSDLYSGIVTGIGTLKGPLHGGANEEAMKMLLEIATPENAEPWLREALAEKKKIMGFGHREYKLRDSRAIYLTEVAKEIGRRKGNTTYGDIADILEGIMAKEKNIHPNVDFPAAYAYYLLGIPIELYTPIFVIARISGWSAHAIEQLDDNRLIRPTCIYTGPSNVPFTPIAERG